MAQYHLRHSFGFVCYHCIVGCLLLCCPIGNFICFHGVPLGTFFIGCFIPLGNRLSRSLIEVLATPSPPWSASMYWLLHLSIHSIIGGKVVNKDLRGWIFYINSPLLLLVFLAIICMDSFVDLVLDFPGLFLVYFPFEC